MTCNLPAAQLHLHHYSNLGFQGALLSAFGGLCHVQQPATF